MSYEAYSVAVRLSLINNVSAGLLAITKNLQSTHMEADKLQAKLASIGKRMAIGGAMFAGGLAIGKLLEAPLEEAKKLAMAKADLATLNLSAADNEKIYAAAAANAHKNLGMTITDNIKMVQDLHTALGSLPHALENMQAFSQFSIAAKIRNGGKDVEGLVGNAAKALEHRGDKVVGSPVEFKDELNRMSKVYFGSKGRVDPNQYFQASQTGKLAYALMDKDYLYGQFAGYMSTKTGTTAGTAAMSGFSALVGGHMDNHAKGFLARLGLLQVGVSPEQVKLTKEAIAQLHLAPKDAKKMMGAMMPVTGGLKEEYVGLYAHNPGKFVEQVLAPRIRDIFGKNLTNEQVAEIVAKNFNRNTGDFLGAHIVNSAKFAKDAGIFNRSMGFGAAYQMYKKSPEGAQLAAEEAWKNFMALVGSVYLPMFTRGLEHLAVWLDKAGQFVEKHPALIKGLVGALASLAAFLVAGGLINMTYAAGQGFMLLGGAFKWGMPFLKDMVGWLPRAGTMFLKIGKDLMEVATSPFVRGFAQAVFGPFKLALDGVKWAIQGLLSPIGRLIPKLVEMAGKAGIGGVFDAFRVFLAFQVGYQVGEWLNENVVSPIVKWLSDGKALSLGDWLYQKVHGDDSDKLGPMHYKVVNGHAVAGDGGQPPALPPAQAPHKPVPLAFKQDTSVIAQKSPQMVQVQTTLNLDGRKFAEVVSQYQAKQAARGLGTGGFDPGLGMPLVAQN